MKSVSLAVVEAKRLTEIGPVTSIGFSSGGVEYTKTSDLSSIGLWSKTPFCINTSSQQSPPPEVGTGNCGL